MLYLHFSNTSIEAIETQKSLIGQEKIIAVGRGEIPEGYIVDGSIQKEEEIKNLLMDILAHAYPKPIKSNYVSMIIPDSQMIIKRVNTLFPEDLKIDLKNNLGEDVNHYEHFYKIVGKEDKKEILYTGMKHDFIRKWSDFLASLSLDLTFLTGESFAFLAFLEPAIVSNDVFLYCHIQSKIGTYFIYDREGPRHIWAKKITGKTLGGEIKTQIEKWEKENILITKIFLGAEGSTEILADEIKEKIQKEVIKVSDIIETLLANHKIDFITQGETKLFFLPVVGLLLLTKKENVPNFVKDNAFGIESVQKMPLEKQEDVPVATQFIPDSIVEYKKTAFSNIVRSKLFFIIVLFFIGVTILILGFFFMQKNRIKSLSFFPVMPTVTSVPTITPSVTPTPTIDLKLKRSDLKISVENGTVKAGYAKDIAVFLEKKGYKNVGKGNADTDTYQETVLKIKETKKNYMPLLTVDLTEKVHVASTENLPAESTFDAIVRLGNN